MTPFRPMEATIEGYHGPYYTNMADLLDEILSHVEHEGELLEAFLKKVGKRLGAVVVTMPFRTRDKYRCKAALFVTTAPHQTHVVVLPGPDRSVATYSSRDDPEEDERFARLLVEVLEAELGIA